MSGHGRPNLAEISPESPPDWIESRRSLGGVSTRLPWVWVVELRVSASAPESARECHGTVPFGQDSCFGRDSHFGRDSARDSVEISFRIRRPSPEAPPRREAGQDSVRTPPRLAETPAGIAHVALRIFEIRRAVAGCPAPTGGRPRLRTDSGWTLSRLGQDFFQIRPAEAGRPPPAGRLIKTPPILRRNWSRLGPRFR